MVVIVTAGPGDVQESRMVRGQMYVMLLLQMPILFCCHRKVTWL
jgi:hypothetical protein